MQKKRSIHSIIPIQALVCLLLLGGAVWIRQMDPPHLTDCRRAYLSLFWEEADSLPEPARFIQEKAAGQEKAKPSEKEKTQPSPQP